jgi:hypothetical protein
MKKEQKPSESEDQQAIVSIPRPIGSGINDPRDLRDLHLPISSGRQRLPFSNFLLREPERSFPNYAVMIDDRPSSHPIPPRIWTPYVKSSISIVDEPERYKGGFIYYNFASHESRPFSSKELVAGEIERDALANLKVKKTKKSKKKRSEAAKLRRKERKLIGSLIKDLELPVEAPNTQP